MSKKPSGNITIENARLIFKDFSGERNRFNNDRTFGVVLDPEFAEELRNEGWPVKTLAPRDGEYDDPLEFLSVKVVFGKVPPKIVLISGKTKKILEEDSVSVLDWVTIEKADLIIRPYNYDFGGRSGTKAYLNSLYVTKMVDTLEDKYADIPEEMPFEN